MLIALLCAGFLFTTSPALADLDGGDSQENATLLEMNTEYKISDGRHDDGWYKVYINNAGARVTANFSTDKKRCANVFDNCWDFSKVIVSDDGQVFVLDYEVNNEEKRKSPEISWIVKKSGYAYVYFNEGYNELSHLSIHTSNPDKKVFDIQSITTVPKEFKPGEKTTIQARVKYDQSGIQKPEQGNVQILVGGTVIDTEKISPSQGSAVSVTTTHNVSSTGDTGDRTVTVRAAPNWTSIESGTQKQSTISIDASDLDQDGLYDSREEELGTDPRDSDTDGDGLTDGREIELETDPLSKDTDDDGLTDKTEVNSSTDLLVADTDGDGLPDGEEISIGSDPTVEDTDDDGLADDREVELGTDPASADTDEDGLSDSEEFQEGTDPTKANTDGDGLPDAKEIEISTDPESTDTDGDGISDYEEFQQGTDPLSETDEADNQVGNESKVVEDRSLVVKSDAVNLQLKSQKTIVNQSQPAILTFSSTALISAQDTVHVQLILEVPSGASVTSAQFTEAGIGQYTTTLEMEPGEAEGIRIRVKANELGRFGITGRAVYYLGDDKANATTRRISIPVRVVGEDTGSTNQDTSPVDDSSDPAGSSSEGTSNGDETQQSDDEAPIDEQSSDPPDNGGPSSPSMPGFGALASIVALLGILCWRQIT